MKTSEEPIIVEHIFDCAANEVWRAITDVNLMRQWYFDNLPDFKPEIGFETRFNVESAERNFIHIWKVTEVIPGKLIGYNWHYENYSGDSQVTFELFKKDSSTLLTLTHKVLADFPDDIPEFRRESGLQGWTYFIKDRLAGFLKN